MIEKKTSKGDLENRKITFFLLGMVIVTGIIYAALELFAMSEKTYYFIPRNSDYLVVLEEEIIPTNDVPVYSSSTQFMKQEETILQVVSDNIHVNTVFDFNPDFTIDDIVVSEYAPVEVSGEAIDQIYSMRNIEEMPEPAGGFDAMYAFLYSHLKYPENARKNRITGRVVIEFVVEKDGSIGKVRIVAGIDPELDKEVVRVINMLPKWKAGKHTGRIVPCYYQLPINFNIK
ncbi:MAG: energy transducer TonB [Bacteroidales bacterium]|jgi:protein TonB|nr:energy transducer TonB [Bacteroidales bacterium]